jgi:hypothetical protein
MPLYKQLNLLFIHIPKNGGSTVENFLTKKNKGIDLWMDKNKLNLNHSEQHCTYKELEEKNFIKDQYSIFTIIRNPVDRVISEFNWFNKVRKDKYADFNKFLDDFLNKENFKKFDNHNLSNLDYLLDKDGNIPEKIKIFKFFDKDNLSLFLNDGDIKKKHDNKTNKIFNNINEEQKSRILEFYKDDIETFNFDINEKEIFNKSLNLI